MRNPPYNKEYIMATRPEKTDLAKKKPAKNPPDEIMSKISNPLVKSVWYNVRAGINTISQVRKKVDQPS
jgi:hypothetical protein